MTYKCDDRLVFKLTWLFESTSICICYIPTETFTDSNDSSQICINSNHDSNQFESIQIIIIRFNFNKFESIQINLDDGSNQF